MNKINKPHYRWMEIKQDVKEMDRNDVLQALSVVVERNHYLFDMYSGMRINLLQKNGALISGYVIYDSNLGGYGIISRVNCKRDETTVFPVDINNVVAMEYSNYYCCGRNGHIQMIRLNDDATNFCPVIQDMVVSNKIYRIPVKYLYLEKVA